MKLNCEISNIADAKRFQVLLQHYIASFDSSAAAMAVRERLAGPQIYPLKPTHKHSGNGKRPGWTPERRAKHKATIARRKKYAELARRDRKAKARA